MDYSDKIFEMLEIKPKDIFELASTDNEEIPYIKNRTYRIDDDLSVCEYFDDCGGWTPAFFDDILQKILNGTYIIKLIKRVPTKEDEAVFAYGRLCGYNWVAVDEDGQACFYEKKPYRSEAGNCWEIVGMFNYIETEIHCLSWKDEPYYIGELKENLKWTI